jgi:Protein of unknown function (DUF2924)
VLPVSIVGVSDLEHQIGRLSDLDLDGLRRLWGELFDAPALRHLSRQVMRGAMAYRLQERAFGGLSVAAARQLYELAKGGETRRLRRSRPRYRIKPGSRLIREWQGRTYEVIAVSDGDYIYNGSRYSSLSEIARAITGTRWSGPRFFSLGEPSKNG